MGIRIDALPTAASAEDGHVIPAMLDDETVGLTVEQISTKVRDDLVPAFAEKADLLSEGASDNAFEDEDEIVYVSGTTQKRGTLTGLIASIFKTARVIANAQFAAATFKLFNADGTPRALSFDATALTADRVATFPDRNIDFGQVLSRFYESAEQTITSGGGLTLAHGLGLKPKGFQLEIICKTAEHGYSIGDSLGINHGMDQTDTSSLFKGVAVTYDATNFYVRYVANTAVFGGFTKGTGTVATFTHANWRLVVRAWA